MSCLDFIQNKAFEVNQKVQSFKLNSNQETYSSNKVKVKVLLGYIPN